MTKHAEEMEEVKIKDGPEKGTGSVGWTEEHIEQ